MDFACKNFDLEDIIRCGLNLTKAEFKILDFLIKNNEKEFDTSKISKATNLEISTIQKAMKKMTEKTIVKRRQINLEKSGYTYIYCLCDKKEIKNIVQNIIKNWVKKFDLEIDKW